MSIQMLLVTGATGETGRDTVRHLLEKGHTVRAMVDKEDERSQTLRNWGAEIVVGDLLNHDDAIRATSGTSAAYFYRGDFGRAGRAYWKNLYAQWTDRDEPGRNRCGRYQCDRSKAHLSAADYLSVPEAARSSRFARVPDPALL